MLYSMPLEIKATFKDLWRSVLHACNWATTAEAGSPLLNSTRCSFLSQNWSLRVLVAAYFHWVRNGKMASVHLAGKNVAPGWTCYSVSAEPLSQSTWSLLPACKSVLHSVLLHISHMWRVCTWLAAVAQVVCGGIKPGKLNPVFYPTLSPSLVDMSFPVFMKSGF